MTIQPIAAMAAAFLLGANALFQLGLAAGAPWGHAAYGGRVALADGRLPASFRWVSLATVVVMGLLAWVVLAASGLVGSGPISRELAMWVCRGAALLLALNTVGNLVSTHRFERWVMGTSTACLVLLFVVVGLP